MKDKIRKTTAICCCMLLLLSGCTKSAENTASETVTLSETSETGQTDQPADEQNETDEMFTDRDKEVGYDEDECIRIQLSDDNSSCSSQSVAIDDQTVTITEEGTYLLSGTLSNGAVIVDTDDNAKVRLILDGVTISNDQSAAIYVRSADKVFITLAPDTENTLSNGGTYVAIDDNQIDSVIFSKSDLTLNGTGALTITAKEGHGIVSKDDLVITGGTYTITSASHGLSGKDSIRILDGDFTITSGKDALHAENSDDTEKSNIYIAGGTYQLTADGDGISASGDLTLVDGTYTMTTGGGSENGEDHSENGPGGGMMPGGQQPQNGQQTPPDRDGQQPQNGQQTPPDRNDGQQPQDGQQSSYAAGQESLQHIQDETSADGSTDSVTDDNGTEDTSDSTSTKGIKADGALVISGGTYTINAADDGIHSNADITIDGGTFVIASGDDGMHADGNLTVNNGEITISESYEGIEGDNVLIAGGQVRLTSSDDGINGGTSVVISGGHTEIDAEGDGIDANGTLTVSGGETYIAGPTGDGDGALDYESEAVITGGILVAAGSSGMAVNFGSNSTQGSILLNTDSQEAGTDIVLTDASGNELLRWETSKAYASVVISCPSMTQGETYTVSAGTSETTITLDSLIYGTGNQMGPQKNIQGR